MRYLIFSLLLAPSLISAQDSGFHFRGTYFIVAPSSDGIVIGIDTRVAVFGDTVNIHASDAKAELYFDGFKKINVYKGMVFINQGLTIFDTSFFKKYLEEFTDQLDTNGKLLGKVISELYQFIQLKYPQSAADFNSANVCAVRYNKGQPEIAFRAKDGRIYGGIGNMFRQFLASDDSSDFKNRYLITNSCIKNGKEIKKSIEAYRKKYKQFDLIGENIVLLKITPDNKTLWIGEKPTINPSTFSELGKLYKEKKLTIHFRSNDIKKKFERSVN